MDKYIKVKKIGEGSFGKAILVKSKENGKQFVVKEINMAKMGKKERDGARKETAVLAQLNHANIVHYRESFEEIGNLYIIMDFCDGGDLYGRINLQRGVLFAEDQILDWFVQTCLAIKHIHDRKILHRDIKSQNIFLTRHGIVKLGDFGIAKVLNSTVELARTCIGTPYYLSPEICENRPYNNKSDIWSLGCVLYELTTLKHAFESGNMKNLVLKIIRGSYPPPSPKFSYELRNLIASLFRRNARERPAITAILRKPLLQTRIRKFLSESEVSEEFSHTVMHGMQIKKVLPVGQKARPLPPKPIAAKKTPVVATPRYDPASVYGPSVARKSKEVNRKSADVRKSSAGKRPSNVAISNQDLAKRRRELVEKEKKRREDEAKRQEQLYARQHRELIEKQRIMRLNKAKEEGWRQLLSSHDSDDSNKSPASPSQPKQDEVVPAADVHFAKPNYAEYHAWLDQREQDRKGGGVAAALGARDGYAQAAAQQGEQAGAKGAEAAMRAREFLQRKQQAAANKARACADMFGQGPVPKPSAGKPSPSSSKSVQENEQQSYLAKLRQIRLQNFNERRLQKARQDTKADPKYKPVVDARGDAQLRMKKIEALRAQADERAKKLKEELEKKRREAYDLEQKKLREEAAKPIKAKPAERPKPVIAQKPVAVVPMTAAMKAIGVTKTAGVNKPPAVGMTAAMNAIGATPAPSVDTSASRSPKQNQKDQILKRLNAKADRPKWGAAQVAPPLAMERAKWDDSEDVELGKMSLEITASQMEATSAQDVVVKHAESVEEGSTNAPGSSGAVESSGAVGSTSAVRSSGAVRKAWGGHADTVLNALQKADLSVTTTTATTEAAAAATAAEQLTENEPPEGQNEGSKMTVSGATVTIARNVKKGTVVITKAPAANPIAEESATVTQVDKTAGSDVDGAASEPPVDGATDDTEKAEFSQDAKRADSIALFEKLTIEDQAVPTPEDDMKMEDVERDEHEDGAGDVKKNVVNADINAVVTKEEIAKTLLGTTSGVALALTTGHFDADAGLLRTCSEPNLKRLFDEEEEEEEPSSSSLDARSSFSEVVISLEKERPSSEVHDGNENEAHVADNDEKSEVKSSTSQAASDEKESVVSSQDSRSLPADITDRSSGTEDEDEGQEGEGGLKVTEKEQKSVGLDEKDTDETKSTEVEETSDNEDDDDDDDDDDDEDLRTLRQSMMGVLQQSNVSDDDSGAPLTVRKVTKKTTKTVVKKKKKVVKDRSSGSLSSSSVADLQSMRETMAQLLQPPKQTTKIDQQHSVVGTSKDTPDGAGTQSDEVSSQDVTFNLGESWQSDDDDDEYFEEDDMFSRLEESRVLLEEQLGCDTFLKAYKTVQAIHEDEDEKMEEGILLVSQILGDHKKHLYPSILQLVMADGVFTEDND